MCFNLLYNGLTCCDVMRYQDKRVMYISKAMDFVCIFAELYYSQRIELEYYL